MLKSYGQILQKDVLTVVCEPEKGHELAVNSLSVFGGANGGYITISIGDFSMEHSIAANGRIVFPFFMGVPENMAIKAIATNDDIRVLASAEEFAIGPEDEPIAPPNEPTWADLPLTIIAEEDGATVALNYLANSMVDHGNFSHLKYKINDSNEWLQYEDDNAIITLPKKGDYVQFLNEYTRWCSFEPKRNNIPQRSGRRKFVFTKNVSVAGNIRSLVNFEETGCFYSTFANCVNLISAKNLVLDFVSYYCFRSLFTGCPNLIEIPKISITDFAEGCFSYMLNGCSSLQNVDVNFTSWDKDSEVDSQGNVIYTSATENWVSGVSATGTFYKPSALPEEYGVNRIPEGWNVVNVDDYANIPLTIEALEPGVTVGVNIDFLENENLDIKYKTNNSAEWITYNKGDIVSLTKTGDYVQFENKTTKWKVDGEDYHATPTDQKGCFIIEGGNVLVKGNARSLINYSTVLTDFCFCGLFLNCKTLIHAENLILDSNTLAQACYAYMLGRCDNLITMPKLPAENLANNCYRAMCINCVSLIKAEDLPSVNLGVACYAYMFAGCSDLITAPLELPAYNTASQCYMNMWGGCEELEIAPKILASRIKVSSFDYMFSGCLKLREIEVHFTNWTENIPHGWLNGVASSGVFKKPTGLSEIFGESRIPEGWTVVNID